ncbi:prepilin peptidase [Aliidiomarina indica]|uniref:prepilin peptidase n=1 Tax=Aliidiomarina indica TaxID=2749147 RepID=UPI00188F78D3|nr:A24 family peptidase [Aliidiomarina indica]
MEFFHYYPHATWIVALLLGLIFGSFGNVVVGRLPRMLELQWKRDCAEASGETPPPAERFNLAYPNSQCPSCHSAIRWYDNIPVLSYLLLKGRCRACGVHISLRYPMTEVISAALAVIAVLSFGFTMLGLAYAVFLYILLLLTLIDAEHMLLPDQLSLPLLWLGLLLSISVLPITPVEAIVGAAAGYLFLWSVYWLFRLVTGKEGMGYGDFKLLAVLGAWLGWQALPLIVLLSSLVGAIYGIVVLAMKNQGRDRPMPFGPFLAIAGGISLFYGQDIYQWYWSIYL